MMLTGRCGPSWWNWEKTSASDCVFYVVDGEYHFVDLDAKLQKLLPAEWKASRRVTVSW